MNTKFYFPALCMLAAAAVNTVSANAQDPIYEPEEGTTISFTKTGNMLMASAGMAMDATDNTAEIHFCDNGNVYFFNLLAFPDPQYGIQGGDTYILGKRDGNKITVDVPQLDFIEDNQIYNTEMTHTLNLLVPSDNVPYMPGLMGWTQWFAPAEGNNQITFFIDEVGNITLSLDEGQAIANCAEPSYQEDAWTFGYRSLKFAPKEGQDLSVYLPNVVGVNGVESNRTAVAEKYFDLSGKAVKTPVKGSVYVRVVEYTDGTSKSFKTVVR